MLEMVIYGLSFDMVGKQPIVLLKTVAGNRFLPIWIGHSEAAAILMKLQGAAAPRPSTHDLFLTAITELGGEVKQIAITELKENTFFADVTVRMGDAEIILDSRPSDAIALAVRAEATIFADDQIVEENSVEFEQDTLEDSEEMLEDFRQFLDEVTPEEFGSPEN